MKIKLTEGCFGSTLLVNGVSVEEDNKELLKLVLLKLADEYTLGECINAVLRQHSNMIVDDKPCEACGTYGNTIEVEVQ